MDPRLPKGLRGGLLALVLASTAWAAPASSTAIWTHPFRQSPESLVRALKKVPAPDASAQVLFEAHDHRLDAKGRELSVHVLVFRVLKPDAVDAWGTLQVGWEPWHQAKPSIQAEVITLDGQAHALDPTAIGVAPADQNDSTMLSDARVLRVPLPALSVGALAIARITTRETAPFFSAGSVRRYYFGRSVPVLRERFTVDAPRALPVRVRKMHTSAELVRTVRQGRARWEIELGPEHPERNIEPFTPPDQLDLPEVVYSTGRSWHRVAEAYSRIVDRQIARANMRGLARKILGPGRVDRKKAAHEVLAWIQQNIRYTGVEFGQAAIVPRPPDVTLKRRFGDCKDLATLTVALLRAVHVRADVALLDTDWTDVPAEFPGFGLFDHAIVYLPGSPALWLDATSRSRPAGEVPKGDQGHLSLVASRHTSRLIEIPRATSADNHLEVFRDVWIAPSGPSRVTEHRVATGAIAGGYRAFAQRSTTADLRKTFADSFEKLFEAPAISGFWTKGVLPAAEPFEYGLEADHSKLAVVKDGKVTVSISPGVVIAWLPDFLTRAPRKNATPRKADVLFDEPHSITEHWRLHPPPGFIPLDLPKARVTKLGPARIHRTVSKGADGTVEVVYALDTGPARYTPAQLAAFRAAYQVWGKTPIPKLTFELEGQKAIDGGNLKQGLALFRDEVKRHPRDVLPRLSYAEELLKLGFGGAAREQARAAVKIDPSSSKAHEKLGWILEHDLIGRPFAHGFDWKGAVAEYRKAKVLDPKNFETRKALARLLERDAHGARWAHDAPLDQAIAEYRSVKKDLGRDDLDDAWLIALAYAGRFETILKLEPTLPKSTTGQGIWIAALAQTSGAKAAFARARTALPETKERQKAMGFAVQFLMKLRHYPPMLGLIHQAMASRHDQVTEDLRQSVDIFEHVRRFEQVLPPKGDPRRPVFELLKLAFEPNPAPSAMAELLMHRERTGNADETRRLLTDASALANGAEDGSSDEALPPSMLRDVLASSAKIDVDGDPKTGYRVRLRMSSAKSVLDWFVAPEKKQYFLVGDAGSPAELAAQALVEIRHHHPERARRWLRWARARLETLPSGSAFGAFVALWDSKGKSADEATLALIAASGAAVGSSLASEAPPLLERARRGASLELRAKLDDALRAAYFFSDQWKPLIALADSVLARHPGAEKWVAMKAIASSKLDPLDRTGTLRAFISHQKQSELFHLMLIHLAYARGDWAEGNRIADGLIGKGTNDALIYNSRAWYSLLSGKVDHEMLVYARRASELRPKDGAILNTVAAIAAELGQPVAARKALLASLKHRGHVGLEAPDWYVVGRMAEDAGLDETARKVYARVLAEARPGTDSAALAKRRLKALGAPAAAAH